MESLIATPDCTIIRLGFAQFVLHATALHVLVSALENLDHFLHFYFLSQVQNILSIYFSSLASSMV